MKRFASLQRDPWIVLAPNYLYRTPDITERRLDFGGIFFVGLRELPIEASSSLLGKPRLDKFLEISGRDVIYDRPLDVCFHDRSVDMRRQAQKGIHMATDMI
ncbi:hypothetical protein, partial [Mesorhizobium sp.]|uniref:hypothetical protein n=1 Tax=Mesorhizobium sp. TaxID=1871066 RepID=UPI00257B6C95